MCEDPGRLSSRLHIRHSLSQGFSNGAPRIARTHERGGAQRYGVDLVFYLNWPASCEGK